LISPAGWVASRTGAEQGREVNRSMLRFFATAFKREDGQALVEYALILALVSVAAIAILTTLGTNIVTTLTNVANAL